MFGYRQYDFELNEAIKALRGLATKLAAAKLKSVPKPVTAEVVPAKPPEF